MIDNDGIKRREEIFKEIRSLSNDLKFNESEIQQARDILMSKQQEQTDKRYKLEQLKRMVDVMIIHDCCPIEAKLKYRDEFIYDNNGAETDMGITTTPVGGSYQSNNKKISFSTKYGINQTLNL